MSLPTDLILHTWIFCDTKTLLCGCLVTNRELSECAKETLLGPIASAMIKRVQESVLNRQMDCKSQSTQPLAVVARCISAPDDSDRMKQLEENCPSLIGFSAVHELLRQFQNKCTTDLIAALATNVEIMVFNVASQLHLYQQHWKKKYGAFQYENIDYLTTQLQHHGYKCIPKLEDFSASDCDCRFAEAAPDRAWQCQYHTLQEILFHKNVCKGGDCKDFGCLEVQRRHPIRTDSLECSYCQRHETRVTLEFRCFMFPLLIPVPSSHPLQQPRIKCEDHGAGCYCTWDFCSKDCAWSFMLDHALCDKDGDFLVPCVHFLRSVGLQYGGYSSFDWIPVNTSPPSGFIKIGSFNLNCTFSYEYEYHEHLIALCDPTTCNGPSFMKLARRYLESQTNLKRQRK